MNPTVNQPFYQSPVFVSGVIGFLSQIVALAGGHISPDLINTGVQGVFQIVALGAAGISAYKRWYSDTHPLTVTKGQADAKNGPNTPPPLIP